MTKQPRPRVTIFSDASYFPETGASGWGCAVVYGDKQLFEYAAKFKTSPEDILQAEVQAAACALRAAYVKGLLCGQPLVVVQIDSTDAIGVILASDSRYRYSAGPHGRDQGAVRPLSHVPARCVAAVAEIRRVRDETGMSLYLRHVKGHKRGLSGRHSLNDRANDLAKGAARA